MNRVVFVVAAAIYDTQGRILLAQRPAGKHMAGLWEFPGGKVEPNETPEAALVRELYEELHITTEETSLIPLTFVSHAYDEFHLFMPLYACHKWQGVPTPKEGQLLDWAMPTVMERYPMPPADIPLVEFLKRSS